MEGKFQYNLISQFL